MKLESINEPTATITLTVTELKRISDGHWLAIEALTAMEDTERIAGLIQEHESLKLCVDTVIVDLEGI